MNKAIARAVEGAIAEFQRVVEKLLQRGLPSTPGEMYDLEREMHNEVARACVDKVVGEVVRSAIESEEVVAAAADLVSQYPDVRSQKKGQEVTIRLLGGSKVTVVTPYFLERSAPIPGRTREKEGNGVYPMLAVVGIHYRVSPALAAEVGRLVALGPIEQALDALDLRGVDLDEKTVHRLAKRLGERALRYREWLQDRENQRAVRTSWAKGKRIVFATDGGRLRTRTENQQWAAGRKRKGFVPKWREPKVLVIYAIDEKGRKVKKAGVYYDATMGDADATFRILASLLVQIGADEAQEWIVVADGAEWIWNRIQWLADTVDFSSSKITEVVDFYHACEHLGTIANSVSGWSEQQRSAWARQMRKVLREGAIEDVIKAARNVLPPPPAEGPKASTPQSLAGAPGAEENRTDPLTYFVGNADRMRYAEYRRRGLPIGSGAVESAVRRIVNLRLKSNGCFWELDNAEIVLHLRAQLLSGRWTEFVKTVLDHEAFWSNQARRGRVESIAALTGSDLRRIA
jgi:hypothetical protein